MSYSKCHKNQGFLDAWQVVSTQKICTCFFQACDHHKLAAHYDEVHTKTVVPLAQHAERHRIIVLMLHPLWQIQHDQLWQATSEAFKKISVDLMGPFNTTHYGDDYIIVRQSHFTKWVEGQAISGKEATTVADAVVQEWIKHGNLSHKNIRWISACTFQWLPRLKELTISHTQIVQLGKNLLCTKQTG